MINMGALALNQLLESAQLKGVELGLDTAHLEDKVSANISWYDTTF
jgi:hypothetical protein